MEEGGLLTEAIRRKPYSIILFDELEKAHSDVQNILLQILDEGELTDTMGHRVDFKETIIIMTSNVGARQLLKGGKLGFDEESSKKEARKDQIMEELKHFFSPEFLNRIDETVIFESLTEKNIKDIVKILLEEININIIEKNIHIELTAAAAEYLAKNGFDEKYGARPLRRLLQKEIEDELALYILEEKIDKPTLVKVDCKENKIDFKFSRLAQKKLERLKRDYLIHEKSVEDFWDDYDQENDPANTEIPHLPPVKAMKKETASA